MSDPSLFVLGAANMDTRGRARRPLVPGTSNPGDIRTSPGGVARNVAENLARLGVPTTLISAVGDDEAGHHIIEATAASGVDTSYVIRSPDHHTASYLAILDERGKVALAIDDMAIMELVTPRYIADRRRLINQARMVVLDANLSPRTIQSVITHASKANVPLCLDPVSVSLASRVKRFLPHFAIVTPNAAEAEVLCDTRITRRREAITAAQRLVSLGLRIAIITLAEEGLVYATPEESGYIPAIRCEVADYTGAGDALTAAVVYGLVNDFPIDEAVRLGVSAATLTLKCRDTVCPDLSLERLYDQLVI